MPAPAAPKGPTKKGRGPEVGGPTGFDLLFGTIEIMAELELVVDHPAYWEAWHNYAAHTAGSPMAYAAYVTKNAALGRQAAQSLIAEAQPRVIRPGQFGVDFNAKAASGPRPGRARARSGSSRAGPRAGPTAAGSAPCSNPWTGSATTSRRISGAAAGPPRGHCTTS